MVLLLFSPLSLGPCLHVLLVVFPGRGQKCQQDSRSTIGINKVDLFKITTFKKTKVLELLYIKNKIKSMPIIIIELI
jgi:hypothetical protein